METKKLICRLCLNIFSTFKALEGNIKDSLDQLLPKITLASIQKPVVCTNCEEMLEKCSYFKTMCINACDSILPFVNKDAVKLDILDVPLSRNENNTGVPEDRDMCVFCMTPVKNCSAKSIYVEKRDITLEKMIEQCLPELDLNIIKKPAICAPCHGSLEMCYCLIKHCLMVEQKIKKYRETLAISDDSQIELNGLLQFTIRDGITSEVGGNLVDLIKVEKQFCEEIENADEREIGIGHDIIKKEQMFCDYTENVKEEVEYKEENYVEKADLKFNNLEEFTQKIMISPKEESNLDVIKMENTFCGENQIKKENLVETEDQTFLPTEEIEIKTDDSDFYRLKDGVVSPHPEVATRLRKRKMYQCECCSFQTTHKLYLQRHLLVHKNPSKVKMYKCHSCSFQTKNKYYLREHLLLHKDPSEVTMYKCASCPHQARNKNNLKLHQLVHKHPSEVTMYKCESCSFQTKYKGGLKKHLLVHKDPSEVMMYKCDSCSFQTKHKDYLKVHLLLHKEGSLKSDRVQM